MADGKSDFLQEPLAPATGAQSDEVILRYGNHIADDLYSGSYAELETFADPSSNPNLSFDTQNEGFSPQSLPLAQSTTLGHENTPGSFSTGPLVLTVDKDLIFPYPPPSSALYSLSYTLASRGSSLTLSRSIPARTQEPNLTTRADGTTNSLRASKAPSDKDLYHILRTPLVPRSFTLQGQRRSTFPGTGELRFIAKRLSLSGKGHWECRFSGGRDLVLKSATENDEWVDGTGQLVGKQYGSSRGGKIVGQLHPMVENGLEIVPGTDEMLADLLVCCWVACSWYEQTVDFTASTRAGDRLLRREEGRR